MRKCFLLLLLLTSGFVKAQLSDFSQTNFHQADSTADFYYGETLNNLPLLSYKLTHHLSTDIEKFRAIYIWVSKNLENDYLAYKRNKQKRELFQHDSLKLNTWNTKFQKEVFKKLLEEKKTICTGYAYLVRELATFAGIHCKIIDGYARTATANVKELGIPNHSWNAVKLNGKWYLCDPTWSSGSLYPHGEVNIFVHEYNDGFFLSDPGFFFKNHYPLDTTWILSHTKKDLDAFLKAPFVYNYAFKHQINPISPQEMDIQIAKRDSITFSFRVNKLIDVHQIYFELNGGFRRRMIQPVILSHKNDTLKLQSVFYKRGYYDLHLKIGEDILVTYTLQVNREKD